MRNLKEFGQRYGRYFLLLLLLFAAATVLLVFLSGDSQESPFIYIVH